jgi:hypothetical protein
VGDLAVVHGEDDDVGKCERVTRVAGAEGFLLDDDRLGVSGVVEGEGAVALVLEWAGVPAGAMNETMSSRPSRREGTPRRVKGNSCTALAA